MFRRFPIALGILSLLTVPAIGQEQPPRQEDAPQRFVYSVRYADAETLSGLLHAYFEDTKTRIISDTASNSLLVSAPLDVVQELVQVLEQLDQAPAMINVQVMILEAAPQADGEPVDLGTLSGPIDQVRDQIDALRANGSLHLVRELRLDVAEGGRATAQLGESTPRITGLSTGRGGFGGGGGPSVQYTESGTRVQVLARVVRTEPGARTGPVVIDLELSDSHSLAETGVKLGENEDGSAIQATGISTTELTTRLTLASGSATTAQGGASGSSQTVIVVGVSVAP